MRWVTDLCRRKRDQVWLDYQEEIGLRHTPAKKNVTDHADAPPLVPLRYLIAFTSVVVTTTKEFLEKKARSEEEIDRMHVAWTKAVLITLTLWSRLYTKEGLW